MTRGAGYVLIDHSASDQAWLFEKPLAVLSTDTLDGVGQVLASVSEASARGHHVAGYIFYEAGYAFEPRLRALDNTDRVVPLACFGVFEAPSAFDWSDIRGAASLQQSEPAWSRAEYEKRYDRVIEYIRAGDVYQVNLTFPLIGRWEGDPLALYAALRRHQPPRYGGVVSLGDETILSFSPELFFETDARRIRMRPMKGTAPRGLTPEDDDRLAEALATHAKDRAENLMIVDLLRNDLGRVSEIGSVAVSDLFTVERYPTVLQMTSGIEARLRDDVTLSDLFACLFPCGSVTGAPKIRAMQIIRELEDARRGVYCGSVGYIRPDGHACFNVAIRTAALSPAGEFRFNVGSGIVFDSGAKAEFEECLLKARFLERLTRTSP